ncbi:NAD(P)H-hydrate epimerase [Haloarcula vallismortis]|uniref:Bifunctional NAD(P)H-hydrate repair enzyme n=2 Tax=Haloarcula vallismortis TaxID=28442 RepID=M0JMV3_HALVA|nr:bifunctional ADP-dependent NAD(P)H-hydrate dehydratase/NAD(P)H-hydrate epimerase [Haloarcula vallismortis]EMA10346.1 carbohydrate kinase, YjeF-like protein [Haloarcula vallismortis ATCC 29715]SDW90619.1 NAD(P)H-hydrate epimerase [Haloarcula vallismortis]
MLTGSEMGVVDENAAALGVPRKQLMESSGHAIAQAVRTIADPGDQVTIVAGRGNNGGDALVAARFLDDYDLRVLLLGRPGAISTTIARENWDALKHAEYPTETVTDSTAFDLGSPDVVIDAMLGTGIAGDLREPEATAAEAMNESDATVLSVDVPSGLDAETGRLADNAVDADHVVTFHDSKPGLPDLDVPVTVADIGIPDAAELFVERGDLTRLERDPASHKGDNGEVLVVGGGPYTGAPALTAQAALRGGADLVRVACPAVVAREIQSYSENLILRPFDGDHLAPPHVGRLAELAAEHDTLVLGPGLGDADATLEAVGDLLAGFEGTAVVDADALSVVPNIETDAELVCTPHQGELLGMGGETSEDWRERMGLVESFASEIGQTLLVKGPYDIVSDGERTRVGRTGNPGMTVGGTGDVLAGVTGALASVQDPLDAAAIAAYTVSRVGDRVVDERGYGLVATDLLDEIPSVLWQREAEQ